MLGFFDSLSSNGYFQSTEAVSEFPDSPIKDSSVPLRDAYPPWEMRIIADPVSLADRWKTFPPCPILQGLFFVITVSYPGFMSKVESINALAPVA